MIEYTIIEWEGEPTEIKRLISEGWRPQGGVAVVPYQDVTDCEQWRYVQAMVRPMPPRATPTPPTEEEAAQMRAEMQKWADGPNQWQFSNAEVANTFERLPALFEATGLGTSGGGVSTEGAAWANEIQCSCIGQGGIHPHDPGCPASPEYKAKMASLPCRTCGQLLSSAPTGEYACPTCGLPRLHDEVPNNG